MQTTTKERIRVRYGETDMMGHAYYANYLLWFEQARGAWCRDRGFTYLSLEEEGFKLPVVEVMVRYKNEIKYDDLIEVRVSLAEIKRASLRFEYKVVQVRDESLCTEGHTWHVLIGNEKRAISVSAELREKLERNPADFDTLE